MQNNHDRYLSIVQANSLKKLKKAGKLTDSGL